MLGIPKPLIIAMSANGPKRTKRDHLFLPVKLAELQATALDARASGAALFSCAPRDERGLASLDKAVCKETVAALRETLEESVLIQLELDLSDMGAVDACARLLSDVKPDACLLPFGQLFPRDGDENDEDSARDLLDVCEELGIGVQFAMTDPTDVDWYYAFRQYGVIPESQRALLFVLGEDGEEPASNVHDLRKYLTGLDKLHLLETVRWSVAAYGSQEAVSLAAAIAMGGQIAPGWAYNVHTVDGEPYSSQQQQVALFGQLGMSLGRPQASAFEARTLLFGPR
ncbi:3-keto-5-aminohexanoate cleavage protein [uncultured Cohaesibacter sp.]|uniref:3-keto-5-aminohexanoate cleavage protein n=1 Tax=uncultured Cohaesibacter sp. TaxID=1002546 RepID=UPI002AABCF6B|nr:3-keto-5-aminohexanoate cleavage protein [uncultured Cohaesibacter sp.]